MSLQGLKNRVNVYSTDTHRGVFYLSLRQDNKFSYFTGVTMQLVEVMNAIIGRNVNEVLQEGTY